MNTSELQTHQKELIAAIYEQRPVQPEFKATGILPKVQKLTKKDVKAALGQFGTLLQDFAKSVDLTHPELKNVFGGQLVSEDVEAFNSDCCDLLKVSEKLTDLGVTKGVVAKLRSLLTCTEYYGRIGKVMGAPTDTLQLLRLVKDEAERNEARQKKERQGVIDNAQMNEAMGRWDSAPQTLVWFKRHGDPMAAEIAAAETRKQHFAQHGLDRMTNHINEWIAKTKTVSHSNLYYGFRDAKLETLALALAKISGFTVGMVKMKPVNKKKSDWKLSTGSNIKTAVATGDEFGKAYSFNEVASLRGTNAVNWNPTLYPYHEFESIASEEIRALVKHLDAFPEIGGRALFDHFRVLVPSFDYASSFAKLGPYNIGGKVVEKAKDIAALSLHIDKQLLQSNVVAGALVAERDGINYPICYWT